MTQNTFTTMIRGFDVTVEAGDTEDMYKVHVVEGGGVPWTAELPIDLESFEGNTEDLDGSNELLNLVSEAAVDLFEASRNTLGQGAGALEAVAMKRAQGINIGYGGIWQDYYLQLKDTPFEAQAVELIKQYLAIQMKEPEDPAKELRNQRSKLVYDLQLLELDMLQNSPEQQTILIIQGHKKACGYGDVSYYLDMFAGSPQESAAVSKLKELLDLEERLNQAEEEDSWSEQYKQQSAIELQLQNLVLQSIEQNAMPAQTGIDSAPNMANDLASLMEGVDLHAPMASKRAQEDDWSEWMPISELKWYTHNDQYDIEKSEDGTMFRAFKLPTWMDDVKKTQGGDYDMENSLPEGAFQIRNSGSRRSFEEFDSAEDRETQGGEIRHDLDTSLIDPEDYKFDPNQKVTLNKKLEIMIGGGVPVTLNKGTKGVIESRYDGEGDYYYVRFEDGQIARVLYSDLSGGKSASIEDYAAFLMSLT